MFHFFAKQRFLADYLEGLTDIHCHLLPGIDDGSPSVEVSQMMIEQYKELGYKGVIATPHIMEDYYQNNQTTVKNAFELLKKETSGSPNHPFHASAEYMLDSQFDRLLENDELIPLHKDMILIELSFFQRPITLEETLFAIRQKDYMPVMAHPERYSYFRKPESFQNLKDRGCYLQLNLLSLSGHYGKDVFQKAEMLFREGLYDFVGTDAHKPEHLQKIKQITIPKKLEKGIEEAVENTIATFNINYDSKIFTKS